MKLYNSLSKNYQELEIEDKKPVRIYVCGITPYDDCHIGHGRTIIVFDLLHRFLIHKGIQVQFVQNFTDVDDKIINKAIKLNVKYNTVSKRYIEKYFDDFTKLGILDQIYYPLATEHISEMIEIIDGLLSKNIAYVTQNGIYFSVRKFPNYGKLSNKTIDELEAGSRIEIDKTKKDPLDFALWKFYSEEPYWDTPWGRGRPGWHIECSAMSLKYLGDTFDIHGGGNDLIFPHHENEIAQSESFSGKQFAKIWMHTGMVKINSEKMSKSLGNIVILSEAIKEFGPNVIRLFCISTQYSKPLEYSKPLLDETISRWRQIENAVSELTKPSKSVADYATTTSNYASDNDNMSNIKETERLQKFVKDIVAQIENALDNDLNSSLALTYFMDLVSEINRIASTDSLTIETERIIRPYFEKCMYIFGFKIIDIEEFKIKEIEDLINQRNKYREKKEFSKSDEIRDLLYTQYKVELIDHKNRTIWKKVEN